VSSSQRNIVVKRRPIRLSAIDSLYSEAKLSRAAQILQNFSNDSKDPRIAALAT
jgi:hypothetical protein